MIEHVRTSLLIIALALIVRLIPWAASVHDAALVMQSPDCFEYHQAALNVLDHDVLSISTDPNPQPDSWRTPGYPLLIAGVYKVAGRHPRAVVLLQIVLAALSCAWLLRWGTPLVGRTAAVCAAVVWALDLASIANCDILLSETLCMFLVMGGYAAIAPGRDFTPVRATRAGFLFAFAALVRPAVLYLPLAAAVGVIVARRRGAILPLALAALCFAMPCIVWVGRNALSNGQIEFSALEGQNLAFYRASGVMARVWNVPVEEASRRLGKIVERERFMRGWHRIRRGELCKEIALTIFREHPGKLAQVTAAGAARAWLGLSVYDILKHFGLKPQGLGLFDGGLAGARERLASLSFTDAAAIAFDLATRLAALILGLVGLVVLVRRRAWTALAVIVPALVYVSLTAGIVVSYYRFRVPATPFFALLCGVALDLALSRKLSSPACAESQARCASTDVR